MNQETRHNEGWDISTSSFIQYCNDLNTFLHNNGITTNSSLDEIVMQDLTELIEREQESSKYTGIESKYDYEQILRQMKHGSGSKHEGLSK